MFGPFVPRRKESTRTIACGRLGTLIQLQHWRVVGCIDTADQAAPVALDNDAGGDTQDS
jgi:hypothetical protein